MSENELLEAIRGGKDQPFWQALKFVLQTNIDYLEKEILENDNLSEPVNITKRDFIRKVRTLNLDLLNAPENILSKQIKPLEPKLPKFDVYESVGDE